MSKVDAIVNVSIDHDQSNPTDVETFTKRMLMLKFDYSNVSVWVYPSKNSPLLHISGDALGRAIILLRRYADSREAVLMGDDHEAEKIADQLEALKNG